MYIHRVGTVTLARDKRLKSNTLLAMLVDLILIGLLNIKTYL